MKGSELQDTSCDPTQEKAEVGEMLCFVALRALAQHFCLLSQM